VLESPRRYSIPLYRLGSLVTVSKVLQGPACPGLPLVLADEQEQISEITELHQKKKKRVPNPP
jgi:hypothetical protein